jgi:hypothetical protein
MHNLGRSFVGDIAACLLANGRMYVVTKNRLVKLEKLIQSVAVQQMRK